MKKKLIFASYIIILNLKKVNHSNLIEPIWMNDKIILRIKFSN